MTGVGLTLFPFILLTCTPAVPHKPCGCGVPLMTSRVTHLGPAFLPPHSPEGHCGDCDSMNQGQRLRLTPTLAPRAVVLGLRWTSSL
jgi:hypothetical protein